MLLVLVRLRWQRGHCPAVICAGTSILVVGSDSLQVPNEEGMMDESRGADARPYSGVLLSFPIPSDRNFCRLATARNSRFSS